MNPNFVLRKVKDNVYRMIFLQNIVSKCGNIFLFPSIFGVIRNASFGQNIMIHLIYFYILRINAYILLMLLA